MYKLAVVLHSKFTANYAENDVSLIHNICNIHLSIKENFTVVIFVNLYTAWGIAEDEIWWSTSKIKKLFYGNLRNNIFLFWEGVFFQTSRLFLWQMIK